VSLEREALIRFKGVFSASLIQTTIQEDFRAVNLDQVHRPGNNLSCTPELNLHYVTLSGFGNNV
jgi:hypothetical protein